MTRIGIRSQFVALSGLRRTRILEYRKATEGNAGSKENSHVMRRCLRHSAEPLQRQVCGGPVLLEPHVDSVDSGASQVFVWS